MSKIHLIAIGGSIMHNLALCLNEQGHEISGSDDQIFEPAKTKLQHAGLLPDREGWHPERIVESLDLIILGMHAKKDNPELLKAQQLKIPIQSFPEYVGNRYQGKKQIVITGSHGKTTITAMLMHVFRMCNKEFDYLVGAQLDGFYNMVAISGAPVAIIEGDEYLSSCLDPSPKFMHYAPFVQIITGVAWDHYNVFPTYQSYLKAFADRLEKTAAGNHIVYFDERNVGNLIDHHANHLIRHAYTQSSYNIENDIVTLNVNNKNYPLQIFGKHNLQNMQAVIETCKLFEFNEEEILEALSSFRGASKRMELISTSQGQLRYRDFAHAPSKVKATIDAFREQFPAKKMLVILELHTYSSLNKEFLPQYKNTASNADQLIIYFDQHAMNIKRMPSLESEYVRTAFNAKDCMVIKDYAQLEESIQQIKNKFDLILFLGSGQFGGIDLVNV